MTKRDRFLEECLRLSGRRSPHSIWGTVPGGFAGHVKPDVRTGELHAVAYYTAWDHVQHVVVGTDGRVRQATNVPVPGVPACTTSG